MKWNRRANEWYTVMWEEGMSREDERGEQEDVLEMGVWGGKVGRRLPRPREGTERGLQGRRHKARQGQGLQLQSYVSSAFMLVTGRQLAFQTRPVMPLPAEEQVWIWIQCPAPISQNAVSQNVLLSSLLLPAMHAYNLPFSPAMPNVQTVCSNKRRGRQEEE